MMNALAHPACSSSGKPLDLELTPKDIDALFVLGRELFERDDFVRAGDVLRLLVLLEPLHVEAWQVLGACHEELVDFAVAEQMYETGCRMGGNDPRLALLAARAAIRDGNMVGAGDWLHEIASWDVEPELEPALAALRSVVEGEKR